MISIYFERIFFFLIIGLMGHTIIVFRKQRFEYANCKTMCLIRYLYVDTGWFFLPRDFEQNLFYSNIVYVSYLHHFQHFASISYTAQTASHVNFRFSYGNPPLFDKPLSKSEYFFLKMSIRITLETLVL